MLKKYWRHLILNAAKKHDIPLKNNLTSLNNTYNTIVVYPSKDKIFRAFSECSLDNLKVVWIGQDPYHDGHATGLCMGIEKGKIPPTLRILNKMLVEDYGHGIEDMSLSSWARQGVLLLNTALTVREKSPGSHVKFWRPLVLAILEEIAQEKKDVVWVALGKSALEIISEIEGVNKENVICLPHPMYAVYSGKEEDYVKTGSLFKKINEKLLNKINF